MHENMTIDNIKTEMPDASCAHDPRKISQQFWIHSLLNDAKELPHAFIVSMQLSFGGALVGTPVAQVCKMMNGDLPDDMFCA